MRKLLLLVALFAFLGGIFFGVPDTAARTFPEPKVTCTGNDKTTGQCVPGPEERYQFGAGDYCRQDGDQSARTALSHIQYQKLYGELDGSQRSKIDTLLLSATEARSLVGLVPCGRSCDDPTTEINEAAECSFCHFFFLAKNIMDWILKFAVTSLAALMLIIGGFILATSRGNPGQAQKGKDILIWTFAGLAVMFVGWMVVNSIFTGLGVVEWGGVTGGWWEFRCDLN